MPRDNFSRPVQDTLRKRVTDRCSNPACRVPTIGPATEGDRTTNIGIAAHITAASKNGPRFCHSKTSVERKSIENGIWLCSNCASKIDRDVLAFPAELLRSWKAGAENLAGSELGKRLPSHGEAIQTLTAALTGTSREFFGSAIPNVHAAQANALGSLDPRFKVETSFKNGVTNYVIHANVPVKLEMRVDDSFADEFSTKHRKLVDDGEDFEIDNGAVRFTGSKLLETISDVGQGGKIQLSAPKKKAMQKVTLSSPDKTKTERFEDFVGELSLGKQFYWFEGTACDGILTIKYKKSFGIPNESVTLDMGINRARWVGCDIRYLPFADKIGKYFSKHATGWGIDFSMEVGGEPVQSGRAGSVPSEFVLRQARYFNLLRANQRVATAMNLVIPFSVDYELTKAQLNAVLEAADVFAGKRTFQATDLKDPVIVV